MSALVGCVTVGTTAAVETLKDGEGAGDGAGGGAADASTAPAVVIRPYRGGDVDPGLVNGRLNKTLASGPPPPPLPPPRLASLTAIRAAEAAPKRS